MKKILLFAAIVFAVQVHAQIVNNSFETWVTDTSYFAGYSTIVAGDTFTYSDPQGWTSANAISGANSLGNHILVTQSNTSYAGTSAIQMVTDTLKTIDSIPIVGTRQLCVPGMILNGIFPVSAISQNLITGGSITPASVPGAGQPFTQRLANFKGYYQYTPVFNTYTNSNDTCVLWATLRKGSTIVANAEFRTAGATGSNWTSFSVPFVYLNCETPDTLVILLSSSIPKFSSLLQGNTDLTPGSVLLVDALGYDTLAASSSLLFAVNDIDTAYKNKIDTINVLANDASCTNLAITVTITTPPANGIATVSANNQIIYTPNQNFLGVDSIYYTDTDPNSVTASAWVKLTVTFGVGISEANEVPVKMYPVPANNELHVQFENKGKTTARIFDVVGNLVNIITLTQNDNNINVANLPNGIYGLQLVDENNTIIARTKFAVTK